MGTTKLQLEILKKNFLQKQKDFERYLWVADVHNVDFENVSKVDEEMSISKNHFWFNCIVILINSNFAEPH